MSERLTDEHLTELTAVTDRMIDGNLYRQVATALLALRARVAQLEGDYETLACDCEQIRQASDDRAAALRARVARLEAALEFYADPDTYCAIGFFPDPPCGEFVDDFSDVDNEDYRRPMPGKRARAALERPND